MPFQELIFSFVIGIASGIVSSVLVTIFYRRKDSEKDRQAFFTAIKEYTGGLTAIAADDIEAISTFLSSHERPQIFKWIRLTKDERTTLYELFDRILKLQEVITEYHTEVSKIYDPFINQQEDSPPSETCINDRKDSAKEEFDSQIRVALTSIRVMTLHISVLGNKEMTKLMKDVLQKNIP